MLFVVLKMPVAHVILVLQLKRVTGIPLVLDQIAARLRWQVDHGAFHAAVVNDLLLTPHETPGKPGVTAGCPMEQISAEGRQTFLGRPSHPFRPEECHGCVFRIGRPSTPPMGF